MPKMNEIRKKLGHDPFRRAKSKARAMHTVAGTYVDAVNKSIDNDGELNRLDRLAADASRLADEMRESAVEIRSVKEGEQ